jgi:lipopolysaccharide O-acetyltransferase
VSAGFRAVVFAAALPRRVWNRLLNLVVSASMGQRVIIDWTDARILNPARIELQGRFQAGRGLWLQAIGERGRIEIGDGARLSDLVHIGAIGRLRIGRNVLIGSKVLIIDHSHGRGYREAPAELHIAPGDRALASRGDITIGDNVWLADNVIVLSGVTIGDNCVVGAHSLVRSDLPAHSVCAGNPARVLSMHEAPGEAALEVPPQ